LKLILLAEQQIFSSARWPILCCMAEWPILQRRPRLKKSLGICFAAITAMSSIGFFAGPARAADTPVTPFLTSQTSAVIHADMTAIDIDAVSAWQKKIIAALPPDPNRARQQQQSEKSLATAKQWISDFKTNGGKDLYVVAQISGFFIGQPGEVVVPLTADTKVDGLQAIFAPPQPEADPNNPTPPGPPMPATQVIGDALVYSTSNMITALATAKPEPRPDLIEALSIGGNAPIRIVFSPSAIKNMPIFRMRGAGAGPFQDPQWDNVIWASISLTPPPTESGFAVFHCKDGASANDLADLINLKLTKAKADPNAQKALGDQLDKMTDELKPAIQGLNVTIKLDQPTLDTIAQRMAAARTITLGNRPPGPPPQNPGGPDNPNAPGPNGPGGGGF
jgi:hypothetical protein